MEWPPYHQDSTANDFIPDADSGNFSERAGVWMNERHDTFNGGKRR